MFCKGSCIGSKPLQISPFCRSCARAARPRPALASGRARRVRPRRRIARVAAELAIGGRLDVTHLGVGRRRRRLRRSTRWRARLITPSRRSSCPSTSANGAVRTASLQSLVDRRRHDHVDDPALVLEQHEDDALARSPGAGGRRPSRPPRSGCRPASPRAPAPAPRPPVDPGPDQLHRMLSQRHPGRGVVGDDPLPGVERSQAPAARAARAAARAGRAVGARVMRCAAARDPEPPELLAPRRLAGLDPERLARAPAQASRSSPSPPIPDREARSARSRYCRRARARRPAHSPRPRRHP